MIENMKEQSSWEEISKNRLEKYAEKIAQKPKCKNQIMIKGGQAIFVRNGRPFKCKKVEGYVKLPGMEYLESIQQVDISINFAPRKKMIIVKDEQVYFRGYQKFNTEVILFIHVVSMYYDVLVADFADEIPALIAVDDSDEENINSVTFRILEYLIKSPNRSFVDDESIMGAIESEDEDEWE